MQKLKEIDTFKKPKMTVRYGKDVVQIWGALPELYLKVMFFASF